MLTCFAADLWSHFRSCKSAKSRHCVVLQCDVTSGVCNNCGGGVWMPFLRLKLTVPIMEYNYTKQKAP